MTISKKLMASGGPKTPYVDDVFSTYLFEATNAAHTVTNDIALADGIVGGDYTEITGYLEKSGDWTGETDGTANTFSFWINTSVADGEIYANGNSRVVVSTVSSALRVYCKSSIDVNVIDFTTSARIAKDRWVHVMFSFDLPNNQKAVYIDGVEDTNVTYNTFDTGGEIDRTHAGISRFGLSAKGKYAHFVIANTYTDLSVEANRLKYRTASGLPTDPSVVSALSPIVYLPFTSAYYSQTTFLPTNAGTGGDPLNSSSSVYNVNNGPFRAVAGDGGMVWMKTRTGTISHHIFDTERGFRSTDGAGWGLYPNNDQPQSATNAFLGFNPDGFTAGALNPASWGDIASWTFRKAPKFFDVVTYRGNNSTPVTVPHNLGVEPGMIIIKSSDTAGDWYVYHKGFTFPNWCALNSTDAQGTAKGAGLTAPPTAESFTVSNGSGVVGADQEYVAYVFAHDDSDESMIKCGGYTGDGTSTPGKYIDLGFEPQFLLIKRTDGTGSWFMMDTARHLSNGVNNGNATSSPIYAESTSQEGGYATYAGIYGTGFIANGGNLNLNTGEYVYMAIRKSNKPAKEFEPEDLFHARVGANSGDEFIYTGFDPDLLIHRDSLNSGYSNYVQPRMRVHLKASQFLMSTNSTAAEVSSSGRAYYGGGQSRGYNLESGQSTSLTYALRRAPEFLDVVPYAGNGVAGRAIPHSLGVKPEMMLVKAANSVGDWYVYHSSQGPTKFLRLNEANQVSTGSGAWANTAPTDLDFTVQTVTNYGGQEYVAYLFASAPGISKIGSYVGANPTADLDIDCGFPARFVLIKRVDLTGNWFVFDTARGIVDSGQNYLGNNNQDPYIEWDNNGAEVINTSWLSPHANGFTVRAQNAPNVGNTEINGSDLTYLFFAIA